MARDAFVGTTTKKIDLKGDWEGEWIEVKEHLGVHDQKKIDGSGFTSIRAVAPGKEASEAEAGLDLGHMYMTQLKVYLVGWSFKTKDGKPVEVTATAIDMLEPDCADEMTARLHQWLEEKAAAKAANPTTKTSSEQQSA